jgi:hypothetical protein
MDGSLALTVHGKRYIRSIMGMCIREKNMAPIKGIEPNFRKCKDYSVENNI